jgi:hypothetical protein
LAHCYQSAYPLTTLALFCAELREDGWPDSEIHGVEITVLRTLAGVMGRERESMPE